MPNRNVGIVLRYIRNAHNLPLKSVSALIGLSMSFISMMERGHVSVSLETLYRYEYVFRIPAWQILRSMEVADRYNPANRVAALDDYFGFDVSKLTWTQLKENTYEE